MDCILYSWNSPGKNTGVHSCSLLQGFFPTQGSNPILLNCRQILYLGVTREAPIISIAIICWTFSMGLGLQSTFRTVMMLIIINSIACLWCTVYSAKCFVCIVSYTPYSNCVWPSNPTTGHIPWENHNWKRHTYPSVHCNTIYNSLDMEAPRCPLTDEWIK